MPDSLLNFVWHGIQSKFYLIGLLYSLNARVSFQIRSIAVFKSDDMPSMLHRSHGHHTADLSRLGGITVDVETETFEERLGSPTRSTTKRPSDGEAIPMEAWRWEASAASVEEVGQPRMRGGAPRKTVNFVDRAARVETAQETAAGGSAGERCGAPKSPGAATDETLVEEGPQRNE